jgi:hypothetical protein
MLRIKAATEIQAWFRGAVQRKKYKRKLEIARIGSEREKEVTAALAALDQAKKNRMAAEEDLRSAAEELRIAQKEKENLRQNIRDKIQNRNKVAGSSRKFFRNTIINNTAASIIQKTWRNHMIKRIKNTTIAGKSNSNSVVSEQALRYENHISRKKSIEFQSATSISKDTNHSKVLHRQNTGSKLHTLPKTPTPSQAKESTVPQNFESGTFNKVFKSTVAIFSKEKEPSFGRPKSPDSPGLQPHMRTDRTIGKSMEIGERTIASRTKRLR